MNTVVDRAHPGRCARTLLVMIPAAFAAPEDFVSAGFIGAVRGRGLDVDLVFAALELEHVGDRSVLTRLHEELLKPARAEGCSVWLGGISLGGYVALCCAERHPGAINGLCLLAPYLGSHIVTGEIERAAGVHSWSPGELASDDEERRVWRFIQRSAAGGTPAIHLGIGRDDRFAPRHRVLAAALEPGGVDVVPGGHDWPTWLRLWERFLEVRLAPQPGCAGRL